MIIKNSLTDIKQGEKDQCNFPFKKTKYLFNQGVEEIVDILNPTIGVCVYFQIENITGPELKITKSGTVSISISRDQTICKSNFEINSKPSLYSIL